MLFSSLSLSIRHMSAKENFPITIAREGNMVSGHVNKDVCTFQCTQKTLAAAFSTRLSFLPSLLCCSHFSLLYASPIFVPPRSWSKNRRRKVWDDKEISIDRPLSFYSPSHQSLRPVQPSPTSYSTRKAKHKWFVSSQKGFLPQMNLTLLFPFMPSMLIK